MTEKKLDPPIHKIGIVGAGTMGSGIALLALYADFTVVLHDVSEAILENAKQYLTTFLDRKNLLDRLAKVEFTTGWKEFEDADIVIEAVLEDLELKRKIFQQVEAVTGPNTILATNTSTLAVTAIAASVNFPELVAGMHFFNPAAVLPLVEVVQGARTSPEVINRIVDLAEALGKTPVIAKDNPGFIVNRIARPFYGEAFRLLGEGVATHEQIDWALQLGAGFRMGPFQLMDLIGLDVNATAMRSIYEQTWGEPRFRPHWIQDQMLQSGHHGRKSGRGFYDYGKGSSTPKMPDVPEIGDNAGLLLVKPGTYAPGFASLAERSGYTLLYEPIAEVEPIASFCLGGRSENTRDELQRLEETLPSDAPIYVQCADITLGEIATWVENPNRLIGFDGLFFSQGSLVTLVPGPGLSAQIRPEAETLMRSLGRYPIWIPDSPALIVPRVVSMLINEAIFAVSEGVGDSETIDLAMQLGVNYPRGLIEWGRQLGFNRVLAVLDHLWGEYHEERYRASALLRSWARLESLS